MQRWQFSSLALVATLALAGLLPCFAQQMHRNAFESNHTSWIKGSADVAYDETAHAMTDQVAHEGQRSEYIQINVPSPPSPTPGAALGGGSHVYYYYPTANAPIAAELTVSVWVKSNRPGIQLMARVVLPKEADPASLEDRLTTVLRGDTYRKVGSWQRLEIGRPVKLATQQQQLMQAQLNRPINFQDAYIDKLMLNVYGGSGVADVWIDELEVGPVLDTPAAKAHLAPGNSPGAKELPPGAGLGGSGPAAANKFVAFNGTSLQVEGKRFFFRGIRHTDTPPKALRDAGFNTLFVDYPWDPAVLKQMVDLGFWLVPALPVTSDDARLVSNDPAASAPAQRASRHKPDVPDVDAGWVGEVRGFPDLDAVLFWNLGTALAVEQCPLVARSAAQITAADRQHALGADAWDGLARYSNSVNLLSIHRWPLMTTMKLTQYKDWLETRSRLANPGTFLWTWIQTHTPDWYTQLLYDKPSSAGFTEPIGPQPEQVRLLTYLAVGSGFRGLGFWSDRFLADSHQGRDRLLTLALLNQELEFLEPMLNTADGTSQWIDTSDPNVKAAVLRTQKGVLVLPMWLGGSAQFVPGQAAVAKLTMTVPQVPPSFQCWEVTPGEVRGLRAEHGPTGGMKISIPEFGLTTAIAFTADIALIQEFQNLCWARRQLAAQYTYDLAVQEMEKVVKIEEQLEKAGHAQPDSAALMKDANDRLKAAKDYWDNHQFGAAYREAQRALRPLRILMRAQWDAATRKLDTPVASPWAVSFYTLPRHWEFMDQVTAAKPADNMIPAGDFEVVPGRAQEAWSPQESTLDDVDMRAECVSEIWMATTDPKTKLAGPRKQLTAKEGKQFLLLEIKPKYLAPGDSPGASSPGANHSPAANSPAAKQGDSPGAKSPLPKALERSFLGLVSPTVKLPPGSLVRVSGWMAIPDNIQASPDGALFYDSAGGEPLAVRLTGKTEGWRHFTLYRRVPASGVLNVTLALTGLGRVAFDDIRIEPLVSSH